MTTNRKPTLLAYAVTGEGKQAFWIRIGAAWPHQNGEGFSIELQALPLNSRIVLMPVTTEQAADADAAMEAA